MQQNQAFDLLSLGKNVFLTGAAGAGKTYLLNRFIRHLKDRGIAVAVTASTGIAATHLQGTTIHSWSGIGVKDAVTQKDLEKLFGDSRIKRNYKNARVLVIDEISMLHPHQLDMVDTIARYIRGREEPFGGIQLVLCGDFFQLPPVSRSPEGGETRFAFEAASWQQGNFFTCYLQEQHRQGDDPLLTVLNDIRSGNAGEHTKVPLRTRYKKEPEGSTRATKLYARNINVDSINEAELAKLPALEREFSMQSQGFSMLVEGLKKTCLAQEVLRLKIGAEVMFIKNDPLGGYVNGTRGVVVNFERKEGWPVVRTYDERIVIAEPQEWKYEDNGHVRAVIAQIPLRLAWAITIHKSQGMTLDAAEMDLSDVFEPGMGYVALSRVRSLSGLKLMNLSEMALKVHPGILAHDRIFKMQSEEACHYLEQLSVDEKTLQQQELTDQLVTASAKKPKKERPPKTPKETTTPTHIITLEMIKLNQALPAIAEQRGLKLGTIVSHVEKLLGLKQLEDAYLDVVKKMIPANDFDAILAEMQRSPDGALTPVFNHFEGKYSFDHLRLVRLFV